MNISPPKAPENTLYSYSRSTGEREKAQPVRWQVTMFSAEAPETPLLSLESRKTKRAAGGRYPCFWQSGPDSTRMYIRSPERRKTKIAAGAVAGNSCFRQSGRSSPPTLPGPGRKATGLYLGRGSPSCRSARFPRSSAFPADPRCTCARNPKTGCRFRFACTCLFS